ncbi:MAG: DUF1292 domain-containing protein [Bacilli bacterium]|nr:DUF1292 domain-containing protein [Bacilli bacterium]
MKGKVVTVNPLGDFYVMEEMDYQNKKYVLCNNLEEDQSNKKEIELSLFEVLIKDDELTLGNVEDETAKIVTALIMEKMQEKN